MDRDVRARARDKLRAELAEAITVAFVERGFDELTVDEAARAAGISRATFFRYFVSKEDVVIAAVDPSPVDFSANLAESPPRRWSMWDLVRSAIEPSVVAADSGPPSQRARLRMIASRPALRARFAGHRFETAEALAAALAPHLEDERAARVVATAGLAALDDAWYAWALAESGALRELVDANFRSLQAASGPLPGPGESAD